MNPGATENLFHLWVFDKFRVVQRVALIFLRGRGGPISLAQTHDTRPLHAGDGSGFGRNSAIIRRMSANRFLGMATSAIWKAT